MSNSIHNLDDTYDIDDQILKQVLEFVVTIISENERVAVVMGTAQIDLALERALKCLLNPQPGGKDDLLGPEQPLNSFSAKISLAYRLGLIDADVEHSLQMLRKIRNDFANSPRTETLSQAGHQARMHEVVNSMGTGTIVNTIETSLRNKIKSPELTTFCLVVVLTLLGLEVAAIQNKRLQPSFVASFPKT